MKWSYYMVTGNGYTREETIKALKTIIENGEKLTLKTTDPNTVIVVSSNNAQFHVAAVSNDEIVVECAIDNSMEFMQKFFEDDYAVNEDISVIGGKTFRDQPVLHVSFYNN